MPTQKQIDAHSKNMDSFRRFLSDKEKLAQAKKAYAKRKTSERRKELRDEFQKLREKERAEARRSNGGKLKN